MVRPKFIIIPLKTGKYIYKKELILQQLNKIYLLRVLLNLLRFTSITSDKRDS